MNLQLQQPLLAGVRVTRFGFLPPSFECNELVQRHLRDLRPAHFGSCIQAPAPDRLRPRLAQRWQAPPRRCLKAAASPAPGVEAAPVLHIRRARQTSPGRGLMPSRLPISLLVRPCVSNAPISRSRGVRSNLRTRRGCRGPSPFITVRRRSGSAVNAHAPGLTRARRWWWCVPPMPHQGCAGAPRQRPGCAPCATRARSARRCHRGRPARCAESWSAVAPSSSA